MATRICASCRAENDGQARYCDQCGTRLPEILPQRGYTPNHLAERILKSRAAMQGERKRVTVLFADIKGSTKLAEQAGAEEWHVILDRFFSILTSAVHLHEGTVNQYTGDGIMALFGAPIAHEDHAQRACLAALGMQDELRGYAADLERRRGLQLRLRVGLNTGEVIVGRIGDDLRMDYTAKGLTVNLAARMENLCAPGQVYISRYTAALVRDEFQLQDLDEHRVDGLDHPVRVFVLQGLLRGSAADAGQQDAASTFIGRDAQLGKLTGALAALKEGRGSILGVQGEAGMGKSRLLREFSRHCREQGVALHTATVPAYAASTPMIAAQTLLRSRLGLRDDEPAEAAGKKVIAAFASGHPEKSAVIPVIEEFITSGTAQVRTASGLRSLTLERIARFLPRAAAPQVLLVEDLHHADPALVDFLRRLCEQIALSPTLLVLSYRDGDGVAWVKPYLDDELPMAGLEEAALQQLASALLGPAEGFDLLSRRIARLAAGNPFFVKEAVQVLAEQGHLQGNSGSYALIRPVASLPIPDTVHALLAERIDRLPESQKTLLQAAALMGAHFRPRLLEDFGCSDPASLLALIQAGLVRRLGGTDDDPEYAFCQPLMQEVAVQAQLESQRTATHAGLAAALEKLYGDSAVDDTVATAIAQHWESAEQWQRAGAWNLQAGQWAAQRDAAAARRHYRLAIQNLDRADASFEVLRQRISARAGFIRMAQSTLVDSREVDIAYHDAWKMAEECADMACAAELLFSYAPERLQRGQAEAAAQLAADAVLQAQLARDPDLLPRFRDVVLTTHYAAGRIAEGLTWSQDETLDWTAQPVTAANFLAHASYGTALAWLGDVRKADFHLRAAAELAEREGLDAVQPFADRVDWAWLSGDCADVRAHAMLALRHIDADSSLALRVRAQRADGLAQLLAGDPHRAIAILEAALPLAQSSAHLQSGLLAVLAEARVALRQDAEAVPIAEQAIAAALRCGSRTAELRAWAVYLQLADAARSAEGLARMAALIDSTGAEGLRPWWLLAQARQAQAISERKAHRARALLAFERIGASAHCARWATENG